MANDRNLIYLNKDFASFKEALINYAKAYFPNTYNDFQDADPGNMIIEMCSYIGDVLSFYIDKQTQENILEFAQEKENLISLAYSLGYRPKVTSTAIVNLNVYQQLPAKVEDNGTFAPDYSYCLVLDKGAKVRSSTNSNVIFITDDIVDFSFSSSYDQTEVTVYQINTTTNAPDYYLLKKTVKAYAGSIKTKDITFGDPIKFNSTTLTDDNIIHVINVVDSDGNKWYEVPYLAQNTVFEEIQNNSLNSPFMAIYKKEVPYLLRLRRVQRRFVSRFNSDNTLTLEFGSGILNSTPDEEIIPNSDNVGMGLIDSISKLDTAYDPSNFLYTKDYGLAPASTTLTVTYLVGGGVESNIPSNDLTQPYEVTVSPVSLTPTILNQNLLSYIKTSIAFNNENRASGGGDGDSAADIKYKTIASFAAQSRNVTKEDHIVRAISMPAKFGTIAKAYISQDMVSDMVNFVDANPLALSLYILSFDANKNLVTGSLALKENLRNYLSQFRILNDAISIKDAYYINIGVNFDIMVLPQYNSREVLNECLSGIKDYFDIDKWQINQPIITSDIESILKSIKGVQSVLKMEIVNKNGEENGYSKWGYDIAAATKSGIIYPSLDPSIFEVRYPDIDIYGRVNVF